MNISMKHNVWSVVKERNSRSKKPHVPKNQAKTILVEEESSSSSLTCFIKY